MSKVLHPAYKLSYFRTRRWPEEWISTALKLVQDVWKQNYQLDAVQDPSPVETNVTRKVGNFKNRVWPALKLSIRSHHSLRNTSGRAPIRRHLMHSIHISLIQSFHRSPIRLHTGKVLPQDAIRACRCLEWLSITCQHQVGSNIHAFVKF